MCSDCQHNHNHWLLNDKRRRSSNCWNSDNTYIIIQRKLIASYPLYPIMRAGHIHNEPINAWFFPITDVQLVLERYLNVITMGYRAMSRSSCPIMASTFKTAFFF